MAFATRAEIPTLPHWLDGRRAAGRSGRTAPVYNPTTGEVSANVSLASTEEVGQAVTSAKQAFRGWAATTPLRRARVLYKFRELVDANANQIAALIALEHGKVHDDALGEITRGPEVVEFATGIPHLLKGEVTA
jgi:malonate-semialdehyde dehydrogenase (acetylating)/methylmalonate-semialdehyde dehydrogenase